MRPARGRDRPRGPPRCSTPRRSPGPGGARLFAALAHEYDEFDLPRRAGRRPAATALLIAAIVHPACRVARPLASRAVVWVGERSYGIYLWHWPVMVLTRPELDVSLSLWVLVPLQVAADRRPGRRELPLGRDAVSPRRGPGARSGSGWAGARRASAWRSWRPSRWPPSALAASGWPAARRARRSGPRDQHPGRRPRRRCARRTTAPSGASSSPPLLVGASVMLGAQEALRRRGWAGRSSSTPRSGATPPTSPRAWRPTGSPTRCRPGRRADGRERADPRRGHGRASAPRWRASTASCCSTSRCPPAGRSRRQRAARGRRRASGPRPSSPTGARRPSAEPALRRRHPPHARGRDGLRPDGAAGPAVTRLGSAPWSPSRCTPCRRRTPA